MAFAHSSVRIKLHGHGESVAGAGAPRSGRQSFFANGCPSSHALEPVFEESGAGRTSWQREPAESVPVTPCVALRNEERENFERDGFVILRGVVPEAECRRFLWQAVEPALRRSNILYDDEVFVTCRLVHCSSPRTHVSSPCPCFMRRFL